MVAAAPWSRYEQALQPKFALTPEAALQQAIPLTASYESRLVQALRFALAAGLPRTGATDTVDKQTDAAGAQTRTGSQQTTLTPGTAPTLDPFLATVPGAGTLGFPAATLEEDPFLQYSIANDLYQEVQILNRALADARLRREYDPYFLRMKVAAIPYRRDLTYDAYANIHLFERPSRQAASSAGGGPRSLSTAARCDRAKGAEPSATDTQRLPFVVPLLVTDNVEFARDAAAAQAITELALAVSGAVKGVAVDSKLQAVRDRLQTAFANDQNSLRTVARLGENAVRVRLGATFQADADGGKTFELSPARTRSRCWCSCRRSRPRQMARRGRRLARSTSWLRPTFATCAGASFCRRT